MQNFIIGIDTGGTYTDAVLLDTDTKEIIATAKQPTTHFQLSRGTGKALADILTNSGVKAEQVKTVAVSSTLATNSVVENKGARVAVIVIGYVKHFKLPVKAVVFVKGGHTITGDEEEPLDIDYLVRLIEGLKNEVDAYGICSAMSIKNPAHELVAEKAIAMLDPKPTFCSHRISQLAGMQERAATAGLHAKLMPVMDEFVTGVRGAMKQLDLLCPMMVIGGNGTPLDEREAVSQAGLTVASGPACSAYYGRLHATPDGRALVVDVGGTTTDIAIIENDKPLLAPEGCTVGRWKTHVEAVDMQTTGVGGDSYVHVDARGNLTLGPSRVTPVSMAGHIPRPDQWLGAGGKSKLIMLHQKSRELENNELYRLMADKTMVTPETIRQELGLGGIPLQQQLESLTRKQLIVEYGFTPTDALHVLDKLNIGDKTRAVEAAAVLGGELAMSSIEFSHMVLHRTGELIENAIIEYLMRLHFDQSAGNIIAGCRNHPVLDIDFSLKLPIIGIGAAARTLLPDVAKNLKTVITFPKHSEVGNAIGAALTAL
ncbi:hydantoinase/oxoprolinase N-terminal domain-containing protein [Desulforhopalus singaporensis]|uniref:N-methylhydantoinase A/oxoprolinase/acetone carboxylase, beta subunit n=1 Tax=Desulforhopalus singaporensis TaxID=91360 RepID=A0A1H0KQP3_9BACT|nr:hydantoinase/oxoprolinase family protein [Desulforhopalus singaporensis]SDO58090.1 N-methylhydantoinase A/oxoprolinase/acetone carboxylase, beta subunit [Desulforhopalus singaporensis]